MSLVSISALANAGISRMARTKYLKVYLRWLMLGEEGFRALYLDPEFEAKLDALPSRPHRRGAPERADEMENP